MGAYLPRPRQRVAGVSLPLFYFWQREGGDD
ncbi:hypothetical protein ES703_77601 [subsurface metagenome]